MNAVAEPLERMVARLARIPRAPSDHTFTKDAASKSFGLDTATLDRLVELGLPHAGEPSDPLFARCDLLYIGLRIGAAQVYLWGIKQWRRSLEHLASEDGARLRITYLPQLAELTLEGPGCVVLPSGETRAVELRHNQSAAEVEVHLRATWPVVPTPVNALLEEVATFELCQLPTRVRGDVALVQEIRLTDCWTAACVIAERCAERGWPARVAHGLMIGLPFSTRHSWAEIVVDETWVPVDPVVMTSMRRFAGLDERAWPVSRSIGAMLARFTVAERPVPLVSHAGEWLQVTYMTSVLTG